MEGNRKIVFISYSWDNEDHKEWVVKLAKDLREKYGIDVLLDQYELTIGSDLLHFMESSIIKADKVLVVLTPKYKIKAENRENGVGYENSMISQEIFESEISKIKFLPILREGNISISSPKYLKSKVNHNMVNDATYISDLDKLAKSIYDKHPINKPVLGPIPDFTSTNLDPVINIANEIKNKEAIRNKINQTLNSTDGVKLFENEVSKLSSILVKKIELYNKLPSINFIFDNNGWNSVIIKFYGYSVKYKWENPIINGASDAIIKIEYWYGSISFKDFHSFDDKLVSSKTYNFALDQYLNILWSFNNSVYKTDELIDSSFLFIMEQYYNSKMKNIRDIY